MFFTFCLNLCKPFSESVEPCFNINSKEIIMSVSSKRCGGALKDSLYLGSNNSAFEERFTTNSAL